MARLSDSSRRKVFGAPCTVKNLVTVVTPWGVKVRAHQLVAARFAHACSLADAISPWVPARIDSYACRQVRGSTSTSLHAYGLAWDFFDLPLPQPVDVWGPVNAPPDDFLEVFAATGFTLGRDFSGRSDVPHIEWAAGRPPAEPPRLSDSGVVPLVDIDLPLIKPITHTRTGEAAGMRISTHFVDIPALDKDGRGWVDLPYPWERVTDVTGHGSSPPDDGYWTPLVVNAQPRGAVTRVTLAGAPGRPAGVWWKLLEEL